jgi:mRNA-degrading endonuclease toxin of MazEF toxin-antitoxin module
MNSSVVSWPTARRGEIWTANIGSPPVRHWVVVVSIDARNRSPHIESVLIVPFSSRGGDGPTTLKMEAGESGLPGPSWIKGHFINTIRKAQLLERQPRSLSDRRMREVCVLIRRSFDPDMLFG